MNIENLTPLETKVCSKCKESKPLSEYHRNKSIKSGYSCQCKKCFSVTGKSSYTKNREKRLLYSKNHREKNKDKKAEYLKAYRELNREKVRFWDKEAYERRVTTDFLFKLKRNLRGRIKAFLKCSGNKRFCSTRELLGADYEEVKKHLEEKFQQGMCWENHGAWHIDHIIPLSSAKNQEDMKKLCHYTNLQPLWAKDNIKKSNKIEELCQN
jgi:hypothetical protein